MLTLFASLTVAAWTAFAIVKARKNSQLPRLQKEAPIGAKLATKRVEDKSFEYAVLEDLGVDEHTLEVARLDVVNAIKNKEQSETYKTADSVAHAPDAGRPARKLRGGAGGTSAPAVVDLQ